MRLIEIESLIGIEVPDRLQPDANVITAIVKVALNTARTVYGLEHLEDLAMSGGNIRISAEPSSENNKARTRISINEKSVTVKLPKSVLMRAANEFLPSVFTTVSQGATLCEMGLREPAMFRDPSWKQSTLAFAGTVSTGLMQEVIDEIDLSMRIEDTTEPQLR